MRRLLRRRSLLVALTGLSLFALAAVLLLVLHPREAAASRVLEMGGAVQRGPHMVSDVLATIGINRPFGDVQGIRLDGTDVTDSDLAAIASLDELVELNLDRTDVSDAGLQHLIELDNLEVLRLSSTRVTGTGLATLQGLARLRWLDVSGTGLGDAELDHIVKLRGIEVLNLGQTTVGADAIKRLASLERLRFLGVEETNVTLAVFHELPDFGREEIEPEYGLRKKTTVFLSNISATDDELGALNSRLPHVIFNGVRRVRVAAP